MGIPEGQYQAIDNGLQIHYHEAGSGSPVVFIHGSGPGASGFSNFKHNFPVFAESGLRTIVPDLIGYGYSSKPVDVEYHLSFFVSTLKQALDGIGIEHCVLVGNSLGGAIAIQFALDYPEQVEKLVLMAPGGIEHLDVYMQMPGIQAMMQGFLSERGISREGLKDLLSMQLFSAQDLDDAVVDERYAVLEQQPKEVLSTMRVPDLSSRLGELDCPILGFWGINDQFCPASGAMKLLQACRRTRFSLMTECGHWVMVEHPELFNRQCLEFIHQD